MEQLVDPFVVLGAAASMGSTSIYVGAVVSKVSVVSLGCSSTGDELRGHIPGKVIHDFGVFIWARCILYEVLVLIIIIGVVSASIICIGGIKISIMLPQ